MMKFKIEKRGYLGSVAGELKIDGFKILTPTRAISSYELANSEKIESLAKIKRIPNNIYEVKKQFKVKSSKGFDILDVTNHIQKRIDKASEQGDLRATIFTPIIPKSFPYVESMCGKLVRIQINCDLDGVTVIDWIGSSPVAFEKRLLESIKEVEHHRPERETIPMLYMAEDETIFSKKVHVIRQFGLQHLTVVYASVKDNLENYYRLMDLVTKNQVFVHTTEAMKKTKSNDTAIMHMLSKFGISSLSAKDVYNVVGRTIVKKPALRLDGRTLRYLTSDQHIKIHGENLACECMACAGRKSSEFFEVYDAADELSAALKIHDPSHSYEEMQTERNEILADNQQAYIKSKPSIEQALSSVLKIKVASQQQLR